MKTIKKRILALWMAVCMALTMMPSMAMPVFAGTPTAALTGITVTGGSEVTGYEEGSDAASSPKKVTSRLTKNQASFQFTATFTGSGKYSTTHKDDISSSGTPFNSGQPVTIDELSAGQPKSVYIMVDNTDQAYYELEVTNAVLPTLTVAANGGGTITTATEAPQIDVSVSDAKFKEDVSATDFTLTGASTEAVSNVLRDASGTKVTLTLPKVTKAEQLTVTAKADAFDPKLSANVSGNITIEKAKPAKIDAGSITIGEDGKVACAATAGGTMQAIACTGTDPSDTISGKINNEWDKTTLKAEAVVTALQSHTPGEAFKNLNEFAATFDQNTKWVVVIEVDSGSNVVAIGSAQITGVKEKSEPPSSVTFDTNKDKDYKTLKVTMSGTPNAGDLVTVYKDKTSDEKIKDATALVDGDITSNDIKVVLDEDPGDNVYVTYTEKDGTKLESERVATPNYAAKPAAPVFKAAQVIAKDRESKEFDVQVTNFEDTTTYKLYEKDGNDTGEISAQAFSVTSKDDAATLTLNSGIKEDTTIYVAAVKGGRESDRTPLTLKPYEQNTEAEITEIDAGGTKKVKNPQSGASFESAPNTEIIMDFNKAAQAVTLKLAASDKATVTYGVDATMESQVSEKYSDGGIPLGNIDVNTPKTVYIHVVSEDTKASAWYKVVVSMKEGKHNAGISNVVVGGYPAEGGAITDENDGSEVGKAIEYTATVPNGTKTTMSSGIKVTFNVDKDADAVTYENAASGSSVDSSCENYKEAGEASIETLKFNNNENLFVKVVAQDGQTTRYYKIMVVENEVKVDETVGKTTVDESVVESNPAVEAGKARDVATAASAIAVDTTSAAAVAQDAYNAAMADEDSSEWNEEYAKAQLEAADIEVSGDYHIYVVSYLDVGVVSYDSESSYVVDLTPMYYVAATTTSDGQNMKIKGVTDDPSPDSIYLVKPEKLEVSGTVKVDIQLPTNFVGSGDGNGTAYVTHKGIVTKKTVASNLIDDYEMSSFSEVKVALADSTVAKIGETGYESLQAAVDAVGNDGEINLAKGANEIAPLTAKVPQKDITFTIKKGDSSVEVKEQVSLSYNGNYKVTETADVADGVKYTVKFVTPTSQPETSGPSGGDTPGGTTPSDPDATVQVPTSANGTASVDKPNAIAGDTVKVTPKANDGYEVDKVVVTDKDGKEIEVKDNGDGTYSFTMPAEDLQPVKVDVTFKESTVTPPPAGDDTLKFSSEKQQSALQNRTTGDANCELKLEAIDGEDIGSLKDWTITSSNTDVVSVTKNNTLRYEGVGEANVTVVATGKNGNTYTITFPVKVVKPGTPTFTLSHVSSKKARTFTVTTSTVRGATGFQVKYSLKKSLKSSKTKTYVCGKKLNRKTVKANKSKRTYYVRVRAYQTVDGERVYGAWSKLTKTIKSK